MGNEHLRLRAVQVCQQIAPPHSQCH